MPSSSQGNIIRSITTVTTIMLLVVVFTTCPSSSVIFTSSTVKQNLNVIDKLGLKRNHIEKDKHIKTAQRYSFNYTQSGWLFNEHGRTHKLSRGVLMSLVHSFSPFIEREAEKRFLDPPHNNVFYANSPAVVWHKDELILVCRIWLDREKYEAKSNWPPNHFTDNYLYTQRFDSHLKPKCNGSILGIPAPNQAIIGDGPIEPRLFVHKDKIYTSFNVAMALNDHVKVDKTIFWDMESHEPIMPRIQQGSPLLTHLSSGFMARDKHWMACIWKDQLHFIHMLDPLKVLTCNVNGACSFVNPNIQSDFLFDDLKFHLRGGTPFEPYDGDYYLSIAHSTMFKKSNNHRFYAAHLVMIHTDPFRVVFVSDNLLVHPQIYKDAPIVRTMYIEDSFIFPVGLIIEDSDSLVIGAHVNDYSSVLLRLQGVRELLRNAIDIDQRERPWSGPPTGSIHKHIHEVLENTTGIKFRE